METTRSPYAASPDAAPPEEPPQAWTRLAAATALAAEIHAAQLRKGTRIPYVSHLLAVAAIVLEYGGDEDHACAALLHDAIEDCGAGHEATILERFGPRVAAIVRACTDADMQPKPPWQARKEAYLAHLGHANQDALLVSATDKLHNARAIAADLRAYGGEVFTRFKAGREGTLWYYSTLAEVFPRRLPGPLAAELARAVEEMRAAAE